MADHKPHPGEELVDESPNRGNTKPGSRTENVTQSTSIERIHSSPNYWLVASILILSGAVSVSLSGYIPVQQEFLRIIGVIGIFGGVLLIYLTKGRFVSMRIPNRVYTAMAENEYAVIEAFDHTATPVYIPTDDSVVLYVPRDTSDTIPSPIAIDSPEMAPDGDRGLAFVPTGEPLFEDFEASVIEAVTSDPESLSLQLKEGIVETFELAGTVELSLDQAAGRLDVDIRESVFPIGFDTPAASFFAVGLARGLGTAIVTEIDHGETEGYTFTCYWDPETIVTEH